MSIKSKLAMFEKLAAQTGAKRLNPDKMTGSVSGPVLEGPTFESSESLVNNNNNNNNNKDSVEEKNKNASDVNERKGGPQWKPDDSTDNCSDCKKSFSFWSRKHHCRGCGEIFCSNCLNNKADLKFFGYTTLQSVCKSCYETYKHKTRERARSRTPPPNRSTRSTPSTFPPIKEKTNNVDHDHNNELKILNGKLTADIANLTEQLSKITSDYEHAQKQINSQKMEFEKLKNEKSIIETRYSELEVTTKKLRDQINELEQKGTSEIEQISSQKMEFEKLKNEKSIIETRYSELEVTTKKLRDQISELEGEIQANEVDLKSKNNEIDELKQENADVMNKKQTLQKQLETLEEELQTSRITFEHDIKLLKQKLSAKSDEPVVIEKKVIDEEAVAKLKTQYDEDLNKTRKQLEEKTKKIEQINKENQNLRTEVQNNESKTKILEDFISQQQVQIKDLLAKSNEPKQIVEPLKPDHSSCELKLKELEEKLKVSNMEMEKYIKALELHKSNREVNQMKISELENELSVTSVAYEDELKKVLKKLDDTEKLIRNQQIQHDKIVSSLKHQIAKTQANEARAREQVREQLKQKSASASNISTPKPSSQSTTDKSPRKNVPVKKPSTKSSSKSASKSPPKRVKSPDDKPKLKSAKSFNPFLARKANLERVTQNKLKRIQSAKMASNKNSKNNTENSEKKNVKFKTPPHSPKKKKIVPNSAPPITRNRSSTKEELAQMRALHQDRMARLEKLLGDD